MKNSLKRMLVTLLSVSLVCVSVVTFNAAEAEAKTSSKVMIGHAASGESGTTNQKAGDQTGREVRINAWSYHSSTKSSSHWNVVLRCKDPIIAQKIADVAIAACKNDNIGYDKVDYKTRQTFYKALKAANWDPSKITKKVETSCTPFVAACVCAAGIMVKTDPGSVYLKKMLAARPEFVMFETSDYCASDKKLQNGDILIATIHGHAAIVVSSPNGAGTGADPDAEVVKVSSTVKSKLALAKDNEYKTLTELRIRKGAGLNYAIKKRSDISLLKRGNCVDGTYAVLKKGVKVKAEAVSGAWIKTSYGWICSGEDDEAYIELVKKAAVKKTTSKSTAVKAVLKVGADYKLLCDLYVRRGAGTHYDIKLKTDMTQGAQKCNVAGTDKAKLKKGTEVTCLQISKDGNWIRIPSGWICAKAGNLKKS